MTEARDGERVSYTVAAAVPRHRLVVTGRIGAIHVVRTRDLEKGRPAHVRLECELDDGTGRIWLLFLGRFEVPGLGIGTSISIDGTVVLLHDRLVVLNPTYRLRSGDQAT